MAKHTAAAPAHGPACPRGAMRGAEAFELAPDWVRVSGFASSSSRPNARLGTTPWTRRWCFGFHGHRPAAPWPGDWVVKRPDAILVLPPDEAAAYGLPAGE